MVDICHNATGEQFLGISLELFTPGQEGHKMYFTLSGLLNYFPGSSDIETAEISKHQWCCEVVLWVKWQHQGRLAAVTHCQFVTVDGSAFRRIVSYHPALAITCKE